MARAGMPAASTIRATTGDHVREAGGQVRGADAAMDGDTTLRRGLKLKNGDGVSQDARFGICQSARERYSRLLVF